MNDPATATQRPATRQRVTGARAAVKLEDLGLIGIILAAPLLDPLHALLPIVGDSNSATGGLVSFLAVIGAIVAMATRVPGEARVESRTHGADPERLWMIGPFIGAVGFIGTDSLGRLGLPGGDGLLAIAFVVIIAASLFPHRLPVVSRVTRRILVAPFVLLSGAFFQGLVSDLAEGLGGEAGPMARLASTAEPIMLVQIYAIIGIAAGIFYLMLIFVPRELADPGASTLVWTLRFGLFYASLVGAIIIGGTTPILLP